jgi:hypothetical protein
MTLVPQIDVTACAAHGDCADIARNSTGETVYP